MRVTGGDRVTDHLPIEAGRRRLDLSVQDLWVEYLALGGNATWIEVQRYLDSGQGLSALDHDMLAQALNDRFLDQGLNHPVPYRLS